MRNLFKEAVKCVIYAKGYMLVRRPPAEEPAELAASNSRPVGVGQAPHIDVGERIATAAATPTKERFAEIDALLAHVKPWSGYVPADYTVDFLGILTDGRFLWHKRGPFGGEHVTTELPTLGQLR